MSIPGNVPGARAILEEGLAVKGLGSISYRTFESNIAYVLRYMVSFRSLLRSGFSFYIALILGRSRHCRRWMAQSSRGKIRLRPKFGWTGPN